jgi:alginate O-acetyltransferase complex protein AlgI
MTFNTLKYAAFFVAVWLVVARLLVPRVLARLLPSRSDHEQLSIRLRNGFLLLASYYFYGCWDYRFLSLLMLSTALDYGFGRAMGAPGSIPDARRKRLVTVSILCNLSILGFFKYYGFFVESAQALGARLGVSLHAPMLHVVLPVGVSFYTFQSLSYTIDVYRGRMAPEESLLTFATFVAFFPQLVAGPIERAAHLVPEFRLPTRIEPRDLDEGVFLIASGVFKKVVIADNVSVIADAAFALNSPSGLQALVGAYAFAVQIYCDFSGYTDIARGSARCLGFHLMQNFDLPYFAGSPTEFWRRWHISLSTWLRDYLYVSLGGNRGGTVRTYRNLMLTMLLGGLWHGAAFTFVVWGAFHGALLCLHRALRGLLDRIRPRGRFSSALYSTACAFVVFHLVTLGWIYFRAKSLGQANTLVAALTTLSFVHWERQLDPLGPVPLALALTLLLFAFQLGELAWRDTMAWLRRSAPVRAVVYAGGAILFLLVGEYGGDAFIYFQF